MLHKLLILSSFFQQCYLIWISSMHLISIFALYHSLVFWLWELKNTGAQNVHQHLAFAVLPRFQMLLQYTKSSNEQALLKNNRSAYQHMQGYCLTWEYPSAIWETIKLSFGSLFLLYSSGSKPCQHVWISIEKGCCVKGKGGLNSLLKAHRGGPKRRTG